MNTERSHKANSSITQNIHQKKKRRHTRIQLEALRPTLARFQDSGCPKCQGYVRTEPGESLAQIVIRCINCGWQPQYQAPIIQETEEARTCRLLTAQFVSIADWDRIPVNF